MKLQCNIKGAKGTNIEISFNPDTRTTMHYIIYEMRKTFSELANINDRDRISILTLCGYSFTMYYAYFLGTDRLKRTLPSDIADAFFESSKRTKYYENLEQFKIPDFMYNFLTKINKVKDPNNTNFIITPCLNEWDQKYDYGRTIHPNVFYKAHDVFVTERANTKRDEVLKKIHSFNVFLGVKIEHIFTFNAQDNEDSDKVKQVDNWLNVLYNELTDPDSDEPSTYGY